MKTATVAAENTAWRRSSSQKRMVCKTMKMTIESTTKIVKLNGIDCRVWEGTTERGVAVHCFIPRVFVKNGQDLTQFEQEFKEQRAPSFDIEALPLWMIL